MKKCTMLKKFRTYKQKEDNALNILMYLQPSFLWTDMYVVKK